MPTSSRSTGLEQILLERRTSNQNEEKELRKRKQKIELGIDRIIEEFDVSMLEKQTEIDEINRLYVTHAPPPLHPLRLSARFFWVDSRALMVWCSTPLSEASAVEGMLTCAMHC